MAVKYSVITDALTVSLEAAVSVNQFSQTLGKLLLAAQTLNAATPVATVACTQTVGPPATYSVVTTLKDARVMTIVVANLATTPTFQLTSVAAWTAKEIAPLQSLGAAFATSILADQLTNGTFTWS